MMDLKGKKIEFELEEFIPLLPSDKQEAFRLIAEKFLNQVRRVSSNHLLVRVSMSGARIESITVTGTRNASSRRHWES